MSGAWIHRAASARTLLVSFRGHASGPGRTHLHELEELMAGVEQADVFAPAPSAARRALVSARGRLDRLVPAARRLGWPGLSAPLDRDYALLVVVCQDPSDLRRLGPIEPWTRRASRSVCLAGEVWLHELAARTGELDLLSRFDLVLTSCRETVEPLGRAIGRPTAWLAPAVDALRFRPPAAPPQRCIDVYSVGRRSEPLHAALLEVSRERGWFYLHSTTTKQQVPDARAHRERLASLIQRTRYFVVQPARAGDPRVRQPETGTRYVEGAAGGALLVGEAPAGHGLRELFDFDPVLPLPPDPAALRAALDALEAEPGRAAWLRAAGVAATLRRHDWAHRWERLLDLVGLAPCAGLRERLLQLRAAADAVAPADATRAA